MPAAARLAPFRQRTIDHTFSFWRAGRKNAANFALKLVSFAMTGKKGRAYR